MKIIIIFVLSYSQQSYAFTFISSHLKNHPIKNDCTRSILFKEPKSIIENECKSMLDQLMVANMYYSGSWPNNWIDESGKYQKKNPAKAF